MISGSRRESERKKVFLQRTVHGWYHFESRPLAIPPQVSYGQIGD